MDYYQSAEKVIEQLKKFEGIAKIILFEPLGESALPNCHIDLVVLLDDVTATLPLDQVTNLPLRYAQELRKKADEIQKEIPDYRIHIAPFLEQVYQRGVKPDEVKPAGCLMFTGVPVVRYALWEENGERR